MKTMSKNLSLFVALLVFAASSAFAATQNAVVYGTVYDATGNPLPGVSVSLDNPALGFARSTTTGSDGSYNFAEVPPAEGYRLTAARGGNKIDIRSGITVNVGDERVILPPLKEQPIVAAATGAKHEVKETKLESQGVRNETVSTSISGVITGDQLRTLPLYNRNFLVLGTLTPNVHDSEQGSDLGSASFSVNGQRPTSNNFLLDGSDNVASSSNQSIPFQVNDSIQEFRVTSATANAEYGRNAGGTVNVVTRRGGNKFHGSAYGYFGNDAFNGDNPLSVYKGTSFDKAATYAGSPTIDATTTTLFPTTYNEYVNSARNQGFCTDSIDPTGVTGNACAANGLVGQNNFFDPNAILAAHDKRSMPFDSKQFGVSGGGAIKKDKWFVFGSYEGTLIDNPNPIFERVPSSFDKSYAPLNVNPAFAQNDPNYLIASNVLGLYPSSNVVGVPGALEFFQGQAPNYTNVHNFLVRSDLVTSNKSSWNVRYTAQTLDQLHDDNLPKQSQYPGDGAFRNAFNQNASASYTRNFTSSLINEIRAGVTRFNVEEKAQDHNFDATTLGLNTTAIPTSLLTGIDAEYSGASLGTPGAFSSYGSCCAAPISPTLDYLFPYARIGAPFGAPSRRVDTDLSIADNLSWTHGRHGLKFGFEYRGLENDFRNGVSSRGFVYSSNIGEFTKDAHTTNFAAPSFDLSVRQPYPYSADLNSHAISFYAQDTWRFHPRWTLNIGVRYEYFSVPDESHDALWNFDPNAHGLVQLGHNSVVDPFGYACNSTVNYDSWTPGFTFTAPYSCPSVTPDNRLGKSDKNNFAPRVGIAWDAFGTGKTVIRVGAGEFYDQRPANQYAQLMFNRPSPLVQSDPQTILGQFQGITGFGNSTIDPTNAAYNAANQAASQPSTIYAMDTKHSDTPYTWQYSGTLQQSLTDKMSVELGYVGSRGSMLPIITNANFGSQYTLNDFFGDNLTKFAVLKMQDRAQSQYDSLMFRLRMADVHGLRVNATYNYSHSHDNSSNGVFPTIPLTLTNVAIGAQFQANDNPVPFCVLFGFTCGTFPLTSPQIDFSPGAVTTTGEGQVITSRYLLPQDPINYLKDEYGQSDFDSPHRFVLDYTWDMPFSKKSKLLGNWTLSGIFTAQSGQPFTIFAGPIINEVNQRVNVSGNVHIDDNNPNGMIGLGGISLAENDPSCTGTGGFFFAFSPLRPHADGSPCIGNSKRNQFRGPAYANMNFAIQKGFQVLGEGRMLTFRSEFYNLFDRANYYNPISQVSTDGFNLNPDFGKVKSAHPGRQIQFAVRFNW